MRKDNEDGLKEKDPFNTIANGTALNPNLPID
jgi:hypothetical protein